MAALALTCCIEDKLDTSDPATEWGAGEADYVLCLNLQSVGETAGRAESNASSEEVTIGRTGNYILLFDEDERLISVEPLVLSHGGGYFDDAHTGKPEDPDNEDLTAGEHYEHVYMATKIRVREQQQVPAWCLVLVNAQEVYNSYLSKLQKGTAKMEDVLAYPLNTINDPYRIGYTPIGDGPSRFLMTNSSYVDGGNVVTAVPIIEEKHLIRIENAISDAEIDEEIKTQLTEKKKFPVVVHVEPLVAKFSLEFKSSYEDDGDGWDDKVGAYVFYPHATTNTRNAGDQITKNLDLFVGFDENGIPQTKEVLWRVVVTGWNINAQETQTKMFKSIKKDGGYFTGWADAAYRSYWAEDIHYDRSWSYPWQYRTAIDYIPGTGQASMPDSYKANGDGNLLKNYSFNDLNVQYLGSSRAVYAPENTYDYFSYQAGDFKKEYDNRGHVLAG
ncbi:MAG: hypothetical protein J1E04_06780, partial [Alistipes sp.]|nr:hypothetical protein [Alistipes sp.]